MKSSKKTLISLAALSLTIFIGTLWVLKPYDGWTHLELGAGNYGTDGHTQTALKKTLLTKIEISEKPNDFDTLPITSDGNFKPEEQFALLFQTLDQLVEQHGPKGVFHVNDLIDDYAMTATGALKTYAQAKGYNHITIETISGDYAYLNPEQSLKPYHLKRYDSVHLKNPEISFYSYKLDGDDVLFDEKSRDRARYLLQRLANYSHQGLTFFPIKHPKCMPDQEIKDYVDAGLFYQASNWEPVPYIFPDGQIIDKQHGAVYFIPQNHG